jgi:hypothetical protein
MSSASINERSNIRSKKPPKLMDLVTTRMPVTTTHGNLLNGILKGSSRVYSKEHLSTSSLWPTSPLEKISR